MHQLPKLGRRRRLIAQPREVAGDQRMLNFEHAAHKILSRWSNRGRFRHQSNRHGNVLYSTRSALVAAKT